MATTPKKEDKKEEKKGWEISNNILAPIVTIIIFALAFLFMKIDWDTMHPAESSQLTEPQAIVQMVDL